MPLGWCRPLDHQLRRLKTAGDNPKSALRGISRNSKTHSPLGGNSVKNTGLSDLLRKRFEGARGIKSLDTLFLDALL